jgi:hypothetical protein
MSNTVFIYSTNALKACQKRTSRLYPFEAATCLGQVQLISALSPIGTNSWEEVGDDEFVPKARDFIVVQPSGTPERYFIVPLWYRQVVAKARQHV